MKLFVDRLTFNPKFSLSVLTIDCNDTSALHSSLINLNSGEITPGGKTKLIWFTYKFEIACWTFVALHQGLIQAVLKCEETDLDGAESCKRYLHLWNTVLKMAPTY